MVKLWVYWDEIKSTNLIIDSTNEKITFQGSGNQVKIQGGGTDNSQMVVKQVLQMKEVELVEY